MQGSIGPFTQHRDGRIGVAGIDGDTLSEARIIEVTQPGLLLWGRCRQLARHAHVKSNLRTMVVVHLHFQCAQIVLALVTDAITLHRLLNRLILNPWLQCHALNHWDRAFVLLYQGKTEIPRNCHFNIVFFPMNIRHQPQHIRAKFFIQKKLKQADHTEAHRIRMVTLHPHFNLLIHFFRIFLKQLGAYGIAHRPIIHIGKKFFQIVNQRFIVCLYRSQNIPMQCVLLMVSVRQLGKKKFPCPVPDQFLCIFSKIRRTHSNNAILLCTRN